MIDSNTIEVLSGIFAITMSMLLLKLFKIRIKYWTALRSSLWYCWKASKSRIWFGDFTTGFGIFCWSSTTSGAERVLDSSLLRFLPWLNDCLRRIFKIFGFRFGLWEGDSPLTLLDFVSRKLIIRLIGDAIVSDSASTEHSAIYPSKVISL